jgi:hypothetical protein
MKKRRRISSRSLNESDPLSPDNFDWPVAVNGYRWEKEPCFRDNQIPVGRSVLAPRDFGGQVRNYNPLRVPQLFRIFAESGFGEGDALTFVNQYGLLGTDRWTLSDRSHGIEPVHCELLGDWIEEVLAMRAAVRVWDTLDSEDTKSLAKLIVQVKDVSPSVGSLRGLDNWLLMFLPQEHKEPVRLSAENASDRISAAWAFICLLTNVRLRRYCSPLLGRRTLKSDASSIVPKVTPKNLLGAMWWQFARVVCGESHYRKCKACPKYFEVSPGPHGFPENREFCTDACRTRDNRRKVREAKELKASGKTVPQIARHFDTEPRTIRNWLTKKK